MIYTVTFNPSIDYILDVEKVTLGKVSRAEGELLYPGGKGINVSLELKNLGYDSIALGFTAGFTGKEIERLLEEFGCWSEFIYINEGVSRINVKIRSEQESEINGQGPDIPEECLQQLFYKLNKKVSSGDILVLAGSIPNSLPSDIYEKIMEMLKGKNIRIIVDATQNLLVNVLKYHPFLVKPNTHELSEIFGVDLISVDDIVAHAKKLQEMGAQNVMVSMAGDGAVLVTETGEVYHSKPPKGTVVNSVGAGDSMVAGFLAGYLNYNDYEQAFRWGLAAGSATAFQDWLAKKDDVLALLDEM